jgi:flagellar basal body-associated protein FliL
MGGGKPEEPAEVVEEEPVEKPRRIEVADLGQFVVNLSENTSFLKIHLMMEYDAAVLDKQTATAPEGEAGGEGHGGGASGGKEGEAEGGGVHPYLGKRESQLRDVVIRILSAERAADVLTSDGKARLKEELVDGLNEALALEEPPVVNVLFTEFIIQ